MAMDTKDLILHQARSLKDELVRLRRWLHSHPEMGFEEYETSAFITDYLKQLGLEVKTGIAKTGVAAVLKGDLPGSTVALRADIDALPVREENETEYKSEFDGRMHACGHDAHTAILLGAARLLSENRSRLKGTVKFIFQPAEEFVSGAKRMLDEGVLHSPDVDIALGLHILPDVASGSMELKEGAIMSSMDEFELKILGKGGHGSNPQKTIDPIVTGAQFVSAIQTIVSRRVSPTQPAVVSIGQFIAGTKSNIIPSTAYLSGTIRCQDEGVRQFIFEQLNVIAKGICSMAGADYELEINEQVPVLINDGEVVRDFVRCAADVLDEGKIGILDKPRTYSEDFALFAEQVPSVFFFLGTYNEEKDCIHPLHSPRYNIDEDILPVGAALFANYCINREF